MHFEIITSISFDMDSQIINKKTNQDLEHYKEAINKIVYDFLTEQMTNEECCNLTIDVISEIK